MKKIIPIILLPLLMANAPADHLNHSVYSSVIEDNTYLYELLASGTSNEEICPSNILNNKAASIKATYELMEKHKDYAPYNGYKKSYHLIYRIDIFVNHMVHYKGGVGNWFDGNHAAYLRNLSITTIFEAPNMNESTNFIGSPYYNWTYDTPYANYKLTRELNPNHGTYGVGYYNYIEEDNIGFAANNGYISTSFTHSYDYINETENTNNLNARLLTKPSSNLLKQNGKIQFTNSYPFGYSYSKNDAGEITINETQNELYAGPNENDNDFRFSVYGCSNLETDENLTNVELKVNLKTTHGSSVRLDTFRSEANINLDLI